MEPRRDGDQAFQVIQKWIDLCKHRRNTYWQMHYMFSRRNNYLTIPLLLIASSTGLTSVAQVASGSSRTLSWITATTGTLSAALAALQRYFRYAERAEQCKSLAKGYGLLGTKLETRQAIVTALPAPTEDRLEDLQELMSFAEDIRKNMEDLLKETDDAPMGFEDTSNNYSYVYAARMAEANGRGSPTPLNQIFVRPQRMSGQLSPPSPRSIYMASPNSLPILAQPKLSQPPMQATAPKLVPVPAMELSESGPGSGPGSDVDSVAIPMELPETGRASDVNANAKDTDLGARGRV